MESATTENHSNHADNSGTKQQQDTQLKVVFDTYFALKDALVKQTERGCCRSKKMKTALSAVKMETLAMDVHMVWMKEMVV
jgi:hypothetical protein